MKVQNQRIFKLQVGI